MGRLRYVSGVSGETIELDGPFTYVGLGEDIRSGNWLYSLEGHTVVNQRLGASEGELGAWSRKDIADGFSRITDADFSLGIPGTFEGDGWYQRGYILSTQPVSIKGDRCKLKLPVIMLDGAWRKEEMLSMRQASGDANGTKIYPYHYPYYYASEFGIRYIEIADAAPIPFKFIFYGPALNPTVRIGNNSYQFNINVPAGGYLLVTTLPDATVTLVDQDGTRTNEFDCAERGDGEGCGDYAFERLMPGTQEVWWSDMFGFDLVLIHERSDFPLCSS